MKKRIKQLFTLLLALTIVTIAPISVKADNQVVKEEDYYIAY